MFQNICWQFSGDSVLSQEKVDHIMAKGLAAQEQVATHQLGNLKKSEDDDIRASRIAWLNDESVYECIRPFVQSANEQAGWRLDVRQIEQVQFTKYGIDQHYHWHIDGQCDHHASKVLSRHQDYEKKGLSMPITETSDPRHVGLARKLSVTINLSDPLDYDGGDLWLTKHPQDSRISELETFTNPNFRDKGAVVVFPSWVRHRVTPVTRGTRYSAVAWFNGPPLR
jgi:PKHD-type hydroxylase